MTCSTNSLPNRLVNGPELYGAIDMPWAKLVGQVAQAYAK